jgi:hypothetical protein
VRIVDLIPALQVSLSWAEILGPLMATSHWICRPSIWMPASCFLQQGAAVLEQRGAQPQRDGFQVVEALLCPLPANQVYEDLGFLELFMLAPGIQQLKKSALCGARRFQVTFLSCTLNLNSGDFLLASAPGRD